MADGWGDRAGSPRETDGFWQSGEGRVKTLASVAHLEAIRWRIARVQPTDAGRWGEMNVGQMVCHVTDAFGCPLGTRSVTPPGKRSRIPVPVYRWLALNMPMKWPRGVPTMPEMDQRRGGGTPPEEFAADKEKLLQALERFRTATGPWAAHPLFGAMTTKEWMRWGYLHTDHHLRQFGR